MEKIGGPKRFRPKAMLIVGLHLESHLLDALQRRERSKPRFTSLQLNKMDCFQIIWICVKQAGQSTQWTWWPPSGILWQLEQIWRGFKKLTLVSRQSLSRMVTQLEELGLVGKENNSLGQLLRQSQPLRLETWRNYFLTALIHPWWIVGVWPKWQHK